MENLYQNIINFFQKNPAFLEAALTFILVLFIGKVLRLAVTRILARSKKASGEPRIYSLFLGLLVALNWPFFFFLALHLGVQTLGLEDFWTHILANLWLLTAILYVLKLTFVVIQFATQRWIFKRKKEEVSTNNSSIQFLAKCAKGVLIFLALLFFLSNIGYDISTLLAGLGVTGIAVAFALQNILEDIFASFSIYFDKPFEVGDFIIIGDDLGEVKRIGVKTTRIQTLEGQELVISNTELVKSRINNYKKMKERRVSFSFGVPYDTPFKKVAAIPKEIKSIIETQKKTRFDRAHFHRFSDSALEFEVVYYIDDADYNVYMDIHQCIHLGILEAFAKKRINFAFPSQSIYLHPQTK